MSKFNDIYNMTTNKQKQNDFNDEMVRKTWHYQKKFGFETNQRQGHEFWNNEADAFKHAFGSADMYFKYGNVGSLGGGIMHEWKQSNNPRGEWNMDSWNNQQGREIAREIQKEYGDKFMHLPQQQRDDIIAGKIMYRMRNGQLITNPNDQRKYKGFIENFVNDLKNIQETNLPFTPTRGIGGVQNNGVPLGFAADIELNSIVQPQQDQSGLFGYTNPLTGNNRIFTREDVGAMSSDEFAKYEKEIDAQIKSMGGSMPTNGYLQREAMTGGAVVYVDSYTRSDGTEVKGYYRSRPNF